MKWGNRPCLLNTLRKVDACQGVAISASQNLTGQMTYFKCPQVSPVEFDRGGRFGCITCVPMVSPYAMYEETWHVETSSSGVQAIPLHENSATKLQNTYKSRKGTTKPNFVTCSFHSKTKTTTTMTMTQPKATNLDMRWNPTTHAAMAEEKLTVSLSIPFSCISSSSPNASCQRPRLLKAARVALYATHPTLATPPVPIPRADWS